jgi:hypothetical protein
MKKYSLLLVIFCLAAITIPAQAQTKEKQPEEKKQEQAKTEFQDLNANGIDDAKETTGKKGDEKKRNRVRFVDADGDGICDGRASGAGLKLRMHGKQTQKGKK